MNFMLGFIMPSYDFAYWVKMLEGNTEISLFFPENRI